jgi:hypothetical protein
MDKEIDLLIPSNDTTKEVDQGGRVDRESNHFYTSVLPTGNLRES